MIANISKKPQMEQEFLNSYGTSKIKISSRNLGSDKILPASKFLDRNQGCGYENAMINQLVAYLSTVVI